jgi:hypothetical protein
MRATEAHLFHLLNRFATMLQIDAIIENACTLDKWSIKKVNLNYHRPDRRTDGRLTSLGRNY